MWRPALFDNYIQANHALQNFANKDASKHALHKCKVKIVVAAASLPTPADSVSVLSFIETSPMMFPGCSYPPQSFLLHKQQHPLSSSIIISIGFTSTSLSAYNLQASFFNSSKMSYYNQNQVPVGAPPPQGYPQSYPPPPQGYPPAGYPQQGYPPQGGPPPETQSRGDGFWKG
ncbi:hypothetical protein KI387_020671, partial [Taxus chinensis]